MTQLRMAELRCKPGRLRTLLTALGCLAVADGGAYVTDVRAESVIAVEARPTGVVASGSVVTWSSWQPRRGAFVLKALVGGRVSTLPVPPRAVPFDVDLGPDRRGRLVAVYSRCERETSVTQSFTTPNYAAARSCRLFQYEFAGRREQRIAKTHVPGASEFLPTIWRSRLAWARRTEVRDRDGNSVISLSSLHTRRLDEDGSTAKLPGGTVTPLFTPTPRPTSLDLRGSRLAFTWADVSGLVSELGEMDRTRCPKAEETDASMSEVWTTRIRGSRRLVERACDREAPGDFRSVSASHRGLVYASRVSSPSIRRFNRGAFDARAPDGLIAVAQTDSGLVVSRVVSFEPGSATEILRLDPLPFARVPAKRRSLQPADP